MSERKPCIRCARQIDAFARVCPYCNWDQTETAPSAEETPPVEIYAPPDNHLRNTILAGVGFVALVIIAFVVGSLVHGFDETEAKAAQSRNTTASAPGNVNPTPPKNVTLVPVTGSDATAPVMEEPITSTPPTSTGQQPSDTTALPSQQYAAAAARAKAEQLKEQQQANQITDPRALTGAPYQQGYQPSREPAEEPPRPDEMQAPVRTSAFPEYKPLPRLSFDHEMTARLTVSVGPDGHVTDIEVNEPVPQMQQVIGAVQNWRFKPATLNGTPVPARVAVDILFHGNG